MKIKPFVKRGTAEVLSRIIPAGLMQDQSLFEVWERAGYHVTPVHYYQPIPNSLELTDEFCSRTTSLNGIEMNESGQLALLDSFLDLYKPEYAKFPDAPAATAQQFYFNNGYFESVDAEILYCMVRDRRPRRIVEIGAGFSTMISASAILRNAELSKDYDCEFTCIEPFPGPVIKSGVKGVTRLLEVPVQQAQREVFEALEANDILFIDSSHIAQAGSDVCTELLELVPSLKKGVIVHFHDILLPQVYSQAWRGRHVFWNEQYLLQAFLSFNSAFKILWAGNYMHLRHPDRLARAFPSYLAARQSGDERMRALGHKSFWIQKVT